MRITLIGPPNAGKGNAATGFPPSSPSRTFPPGRPSRKRRRRHSTRPIIKCRKEGTAAAMIAVATQGGHDGGVRQFARMQRTGMTRFARTGHRHFQDCRPRPEKIRSWSVGRRLVYIGFLWK
jgi:hypothetical protein